MSSGQKQMVWNTRERALSSDNDRAEQFVACDRSQLARFRFNDARLNYFLEPGVAKQNVGGEAPLSGDVYGGLMVDPQTTSLLVTPGELGCLFPDPSITADDSPYMLINDPGLQTAGILTFTANASGQPRVDLVECHPVSTILETDNRDIFNPTTGLFAPATVTKVQAFRLQYRVRTGTGGAGVPALQAGWLPLAAIVVPTSAADFSTCDFYDVRPLVEERLRPQPGTNGYYPVDRAEWTAQIASAVMTVHGFSFASFGGYLAGGQLRTTAPSFGAFGGTTVADGDYDGINLDVAGNQAVGFAHVADRLNVLGAFFPGGLPRWVRYSQTAIGGGFGRVPRGPRGVVTVFNTPGSVGAGTGLITANLLVFGTTPGVTLGVVKTTPAGTAFSLENTNDRFTLVESPITDVAGSVGAHTADFPFGTNTSYPEAARLARIVIGLAFTTGAALVEEIEFFLRDNLSVELCKVHSSSIVATGAGSFFQLFTFDVPLRARPHFNDPMSGFTIRAVVLSATVAVAGSQFSSVLGWRLGS